MKRFVFPLHQIRAWNATRLKLEETELEALIEHQRRVEAAYAKVCADRSDLEQQTLRQPLIEASELGRIEQFRVYAMTEGRRLLASQADYAKAIAERRGRIVELKRKIALLDKLRERQQEAWSAEEAKELQAAADEAFLQKLVAQRRVVS